ncbi:MAG: hypothetical protein IKD75_04840 [Prevotella sp.]|nr:hypothetical protein [Prevotella sp.]
MDLEGLRGMFEGGNFPNAQINVIPGDHAQISYEAQKSRDKNQNDSYQQKKEAILEYVGRLKPVVKEECLGLYERIWEGIMELSQVKDVIFDKGKQQDTTFNRNLVAQIIHQISSFVYLPTANTVQMAECLEPEKGVDHPVRQKLGETPDKPIKKSIEEFLKEVF